MNSVVSNDVNLHLTNTVFYDADINIVLLLLNLIELQEADRAGLAAMVSCDSRLYSEVQFFFSYEVLCYYC